MGIMKTQDVLWFDVFEKVLSVACLITFWTSLSETHCLRDSV